MYIQMCEKLNKILNKYRWQCIFLLYAPYMYSMNFRNGSIKFLDDFFEFARVIVAGILLIWFIFVAKKKPSKLTIILFLMELWQLITTCFTSKKIVVAIYDAASSLAIPLLIELFLEYKEDLVKAMMLHHELAIYPNLITLLVYFGKDGRYGNGFFYLGDYTILYEFYLPAIAIASVYIYLTKKTFRGMLLIAVSTISCFLSPSATTKVGILIALMIFAYGMLIKKNRDVSITAMFVFSLILNVFIVCIYSTGKLHFLDSFITNVLHKSVTFSGRIWIWPRDIEMIKEKLLFGHGYRTTVQIESGFIANHAHNALLDKALVGGIPQLLLFILMHVELLRKTERTKSSIYKIVMVALMTAIFISYITDQLFKFWRFYVIFFLLYHLDEIIDGKGLKNE